MSGFIKFLPGQQNLVMINKIYLCNCYKLLCTQTIHNSNVRQFQNLSWCRPIKMQQTSTELRRSCQMPFGKNLFLNSTSTLTGEESNSAKGTENVHMSNPVRGLMGNLMLRNDLMRMDNTVKNLISVVKCREVMSDAHIPKLKRECGLSMKSESDRNNCLFQCLTQRSLAQRIEAEIQNKQRSEKSFTRSQGDNKQKLQKQALLMKTSCYPIFNKLASTTCHGTAPAIVKAPSQKQQTLQQREDYKYPIIDKIAPTFRALLMLRSNSL